MRFHQNCLIMENIVINNTDTENLKNEILNYVINYINNYQIDFEKLYNEIYLNDLISKQAIL